LSGDGEGDDAVDDEAAADEGMLYGIARSGAHTRPYSEVTGTGSSDTSAAEKEQVGEGFCFEIEGRL
jgi:hypothetical protein